MSRKTPVAVRPQLHPLEPREVPAITAAAAVTFTPGNNPQGFAIVDVNADGRPDLITANANADTVTVLLNNTPAGGTPAFLGSVAFAVGSNPRSVTVGDFNADGKPDLAVGNRSGDSVSILLNTTTAGATTPAFAAQVAFGVGDGPSSVVVGDFNADGRPDFATANDTSDNMSVRLNTTAAGAATPTFAASVEFAAGNEPRGIAAADFNADGKLDLVTANNSADTISVFLNTTANGAATPTFDPPTAFVTGDEPRTLAVGEFNADGRPDVVVANNTANTVLVLLNTTAGGATPRFDAQLTMPVRSNPQSVAVADLNGDSRPDVVVANLNGGTLSVFENSTIAGAATATFLAEQPYATQTSPQTLAIADLNADGRPDVASTLRTPDLVVVFPNTTPPPQPTISDIGNQSGDAPFGPIAFTVNDVNTPAGQLALSATSSNLALVPNGNVTFGGSGANRTVFVNPTAGQSGTATITVTVTDADGRTATDTFTVTVPPPPVSPPPASPPTPTTDLFAVATGPGVPVQVNVFNANGSLRFSLTPFADFGGGATVATGDVTGDGVDDILVGAGAGGGPHVKLFDGATGAELRSFYAYTEAFSGGVFVGVGDVTGDGKPDLVTGAGAGGGPHVKVFDGVTNDELRSFFAYVEQFAGGVSVRAGDTNADGFADIVTGAGPGGGPHLKVFSGKDGSELQSFFVGDPASTAGVFVGIGNFKPTTALPEIVGSVNGVVRVFGSAGPGLPYIEQDNITPFVGVAKVVPAAIRLDDGIIAILVGAAGKSTPHVKIIDSESNTLRNSFFAFDSLFTGGVAVG